jgi:hypothetical protein
MGNIQMIDCTDALHISVSASGMMCTGLPPSADALGLADDKIKRVRYFTFFRYDDLIVYAARGSTTHETRHPCRSRAVRVQRSTCSDHY